MAFRGSAIVISQRKVSELANQAAGGGRVLAALRWVQGWACGCDAGLELRRAGFKVSVLSGLLSD